MTNCLLGGVSRGPKVWYFGQTSACCLSWCLSGSGTPWSMALSRPVGSGNQKAKVRMHFAFCWPCKCLRRWFLVKHSLRQAIQNEALPRYKLAMASSVWTFAWWVRSDWMSTKSCCICRRHNGAEAPEGLLVFLWIRKPPAGKSQAM